MKKENALDQLWECNDTMGSGLGTRDSYFKTRYEVRGASPRKIIALITAIIFAWSMCITPVMAETIKVEGGSIDVNVKDKTTNWNVTGNPVWNVPEFNVPTGNIYNIAGLNQNASLALLVNGGKATNIFGTMNLNNLDFILQNIAGINIGSTGMINLNNASLLASTLPLNLSATDFLAHDYQFSGQGGFLMNNGKIVGNNADLVALISNAMENNGVIEVPMGTVALAAGNTVTVGISGDGLVSIGVDEATANTMGLKDQIKNTGTITADGGKVILSAKALDGLFENAINLQSNTNSNSIVRADNGSVEFESIGDITNEGLIQAKNGEFDLDTFLGSFTNKGTIKAYEGDIKLTAGQSVYNQALLEAVNGKVEITAKKGEAVNDGTIDATNGKVTVTARQDVTNNASILAPHGEVWMISKDGNIKNAGDVKADHGSINLTAEQSAYNQKLLEAMNGKVEITAKQGEVKNTGTIDATAGTIDVSAREAVMNEALMKAAEGKIDLTSTEGAITNPGTLDAKNGTIEMQAAGDIETSGNLSAAYLREKAAAFRIGGGYHVRESHHDNLDNAITFSASATVDGSEDLPGVDGLISDVADIIINSGVTLTLGSDFTFRADSNSDGTGAFLMNSGAFIAGAGHSLSIYSSGSPTLGSISNVNIFSLNAQTGTPTYTANPTTTTWSGITDFRIDSGKLNRFTGSGTSGAPYQIYDVYGLQAMGGYLTNYFKLANNIDATSTPNWNGWKGFIPVGNATTKFQGTFDGNSKTITGLVIQNSTYQYPHYSYVGLFGYTDGATIRDIGLVGGSVRYTDYCDYVGGLVGYADNYTSISNAYNTGSVSGYDYAGGLVGFSDNHSSITNSYATGNVSARDDYAGGLVGTSNNYTTITNSYATGNASASAYAGGLVGISATNSSITGSYATGNASGFAAGGLVGSNVASIANSFATGNANGTVAGGLIGINNGSVSNSYATGNVGGDIRLGGLIGMNYGSITNSYAMGNVTGSTDVGGLVGYNTSTIQNSYSTGVVTATSNTPGGLIGNYASGTLTNNFWNYQTAGLVQTQDTGNSGNVAGVTGKTTAEMKTQSTFTGWDFVGTWSSLAGQNPDLLWEVNVWSGSGLWSTASNWSKNSVPTTYTKVIFNNTSTNASTIDSSFGGSVARLSILSGYTGAITQARSLAPRSLYQNGGTYNAGANTITLTDDFLKTGGTFNGGTGAVTFSGAGARTLVFGGASFYDVSFNNASGIWTASDPLSVAHDFTLTAGTFIAPASMTVGGSWTRSGGTFTPGSGSVTFNAGTTGKTITSGGSSFYDIAFGNAAGGWTISDPMTVTHDFTLTNGAVTQSANVAITHNYTQTGGTFTATAPATQTFSVGNSFSIPLTDDSFMRYTGNGSLFPYPGTPYVIYDVYGLQAMKQDLDAYYKLNGNIDASGTANWNGGLGFEPVGYSTLAWGNPPTNPFTGTFDGQNYAITGLTINRPGTSANGLFGYANAAIIGNVGLVNVAVTGPELVGGLVGEAISSTITNAYATGIVTGTYMVGGLIGWSTSSTLQDSYANVTVNGNQLGGGLVGANQNNSSITNSYAMGAVTGQDSVGGFAGSNDHSDITNAYSLGVVTGNTNKGGFVGKNVSGTYSNNYWWKETGHNNTLNDTGSGDIANISTLTDSAMKQQASFSGWDFTNSWWMPTEEGWYPRLQAGYNVWIGSGMWGVAENWSRGHAPTASEKILFHSRSTNNSYFDWGYPGAGTVGEIYIDAGYTGELFNGATSLTINGDYTQFGGTFTGNESVDVNGNFFLGGGTFKAPSSSVSVSGNWTYSGGTFTPGTVNVIFDAAATGKTITSGGSSFYNVTFNNAAGGWTISDAMTVANDFTLTAGAVTQSANLMIAHDYAQAGGTFTDAAPTSHTFTVGNSFSIPMTDNSFMRYTGDGLSSGTAYMIRDVYDLQAMQQDLDAYYKLNNNITATGTSTWNGPWGFAPVGAGWPAFSGSFDGNNKTITGLYIRGTNDAYAGLFGYTNGATIKNVGLIGGTTEGNLYTGGLIGWQDGGTVDNSYNTGTVKGWNYSGDAGGLIGIAQGAVTITNSYATGNVRGEGYTGGLLGYLSGTTGTISNSYATGDVVAPNYSGVAGGFVGYMQGGAISDSYAIGDVTAGSSAGGFFAQADGGSITRSYALGDVTSSGGGSLVGGFGGSNRSVITKSFATGNVTTTAAATSVGGFVASNDASISNAYSTGNVSGGTSTYTGGFAGQHSGTLQNVYAAGTVSGSGTRGGLVAINAGTVNSSYYDKTVQAGMADEALYGKTTAEMKDQATFTGWDFANTWGTLMHSYPDLFWEVNVWSGSGLWSTASNWSQNAVPNASTKVIFNGTSTNASSIDSSFGGSIRNLFVDSGYSGTITQNRPLAISWNYNQTAGAYTATAPVTNTLFVGKSFSIPDTAGAFSRFSGSGTSGSPYMIYDVYGLQGMKGYVASGTYLSLANNIDASSTANWNAGVGFDPVGYSIGAFQSLPTNPFTGTFNGASHMITGLTINRPAEDFVGLFGAIAGANIMNVGLVGGSITGGSSVGSLVGSSWNSSAITSSYSTEGVNGITSVGGLVGYNNTATIASSYATGNINGSSTVGGLTGDIFNSTISNSYATGNVTDSGSQAGGLSGSGGNPGSTILNSYATGNVSGSAEVGGLVGHHGENFNIKNSYATGTISGGSNLGGLVGYVQNGSSNVVNSYFTDATHDNGVGTLAAPNSLKNSSHAVYTGTSPWDFANTWTTVEGLYPKLQMEYNVWTGSGLWSTAANWSRGYVPSTAYKTLFNSRSTNASTINAGFAGTVSDLYVDTGYTGTITQSSALNVNGNYWQNSGTFTGNAVMDINGDFRLTGGAFTAPTLNVGGSWTKSGGTFTPGTRTVTFDAGATGKTITSGGSLFYDVAFNNAAGGWTIADPMTVTHDFMLTNGAVAQNANLAVTHDYTQTGGTFTDAAPLAHTFSVGHSFSIPAADDSFMRYTGDGLTADTAYMIRDVYDLQAVKQDLDAYYKLNNDIAAVSTSNWNSGHGFAPLGGGWPDYFSGSFDGQNHVITNIYINYTDQPYFYYVGLFGYADGTIKNVGLVGGSVTGYDMAGGLLGSGGATLDNVYNTATVSARSWVGGLASESYGLINNSYNAGTVTATGNDGGSWSGAGGLAGIGMGTISNSYNTGTISGVAGPNGVQVGGLVGSNDFGVTLSNSYNTGAVSISGSGNAGGLVGSFSGTMTNSYNEGSVTGTGAGNNVGGLAGSANWSTIGNSYNRGTVTGAGDTAGGLVGTIYGGSTPTITNSYSAGTVTGTATNKGGFIGSWDGTGTLTNNWWLKNGTNNPLLSDYSNNQDASAAKIDTEATLANFYSPTHAVYQNSDLGGGDNSWDFTNTWTMMEGGYSKLQMEYNIWTGSGLWSVATNWSKNMAPTSASKVIFNGTSAGDSSIDSDFSGTIGRLWINSGYGGTITQGRSLTLGIYAQDGGTYDAGANTITITGNWTKSGGNFNAGASTVDFAGTGTQTLDTGGSSLANLSHSGSGMLQLSTNNLNTTGTLTNSSGTFDANGRAVTAAGLATVSGGSYLTKTGTQTFNGGLTMSGTGSFTGSTGIVDAAGVSISGTGIFTAPDASGSLLVSGNWTKTGGTFTPGTGTGTFDGGGTQTLSSGGSSFTNIDHTGIGTLQLLTNDLTTTGTLTNSNGIFDANGRAVTSTGLATVSGGSYLAKTGIQTFNGGLTVSGTGAFTGSTGAVDVTNVSIAGGTLTAPNGLFTVSGDWIKSDGIFTPGTGAVTFDGGGTQTLDSGGSSFANLSHTGSSTLQLLTNDLTTTGTLTSSAGTFNANGLAVTAGGLTIVSGGTYVAGSGKQRFDGGLTVSGTGTFTGSTGIVDVANITISGGTFTAPSTGLFTVSGNWLKSGGAFTPGTGTVTFDGLGAQSLTSGGSSFNAVTVSKTGVLQLQDPLAVTGQLSVNSGTLDVNNKTLSQGGNWAFTGLINLGAVNLTGSGKTITSGLTDSFNALTITGAYTLADALRVTNNLDVQGTLNAAGMAISEGGSWVFTGLSNLGNVTLTGSGKTITSGAIPFSNLTITGTYSLASVLDVTGALTIGSGGSLDIAGNNITTTTNITNNGTLLLQGGETISDTDVINNDGSLVQYNGAGAKTVKAWSYHDLTLAGTALYTVASGAAIGGAGAIIGSARAVMTVSATGISRVYDATQNATVTLSNNNLFTSYDVSVGGYTALFNTKNVGASKPITVTGLTLGGADAAKFSLSSTTAATTADITAFAVTFSGVTATNKVYDGTTVATVSGGAFAGKFGGDFLTVSSTGVFNNKNVGSGKTVTLTNTFGGADRNNYAITDQPTTTADITAKALTINGVTASDKVYDATTIANLNTGSASLVGVIGLEDVSLNSTNKSGLFGDKNVGGGKAVTASGFALSGADVSNYSVTQPLGLTASITTKAVTLSGIIASNKAYDATTDATVSGGTFAGKIGSDFLTISSTGVFNNKNVGVGKTVTLANTFGGADRGNYAITDQLTTTANITAKALTISGVTASSKVYDATTVANLNAGSAALVGVIGSEDVSLNSTNKLGLFSDKNVGVGKAVTVAGFALSGADVSNYSIVQPVGLTADITTKAVTLSGITASSKVYDGTTVAAASGGTFAGKIGSDDLTVSSIGVFNNKNVGTGKTVTLANTFSGADRDNYAITDQGTTTADITAKALTISGVTASNKVYDATTAANLNTASAALVGVVGSEDVSLNSTNKLGVFSDKNVGTGKSVTASGFALSGGDISNYTISQPAGLTANITRRTLTLDATGVDRVYDGTTDAQLTFSDNRVAGDVLTPSATSASFLDKYVGAAKTVNVSGLSITGVDAANYALSSTTATTVADITAIVTGAISGIGGGVSVALSLNGGTPVTTTTNANGSFTFGGDLFVSAGDSMMIYVNNWAYQANLAGKVLEPVNVTGLNLANGQVSIGSASAVNIASSYTNADLAAAKGALSDHIYYSVPSNALAVNGADLFVPAGVTFTPGGNVTATGDLNVAGTYNQDSNLAVTGDFALATGGTFLDASPLSHTFSVGGSFSVPFATAGFRRYTGTGTADDPFIIRNIYDLQAVKSNLTSHFKLYSSLDAASVASWNNNTGFDPIGDRDNLFMGSLNGNGKVISNLEVDRAGSDYLGLFGNIGSTGSVSNLALEDISIYGHDYVGGLSGLNAGSLSNVYTTGVQTVSGVNFVGGLVGGNTGSVANAYSSARVIGTNKVGGLVGENSGSGTIQKTYAMGYVTGTSSNVGGLVGSNTNGATSSVSDSFWNISSTGQVARNNVKEGTGISVTDTSNPMMSQGTYAGWDFQSTWVMDNSGTYPHFQFRYPEGVRGVSGVVYINSKVGEITTEARAGAGKEVSVSYSPNTTGAGVYLDTTATGANSGYYVVLGKNAVGSSDYVIGTSLNGSTRMLASSGSVYPLNIWASETHTLVRATLPNANPIVNPADGGNNGVNSALIITTPTITPNIGTPTPTVTIVDQTPIGKELSTDLQGLMGGVPATPAINPIVISTEPTISPDSKAGTKTSDTLGVAESINDGDISFSETSPTGREPVPVKTDGGSASGSGSASGGTSGMKTASGEGGESKSAASKDDGKEVKWHDVPLTGFSGAENPKKFLTDVRVLEGTVYVLDGANMMSLLGRGESLRILLKGKSTSEPKTQPATSSQPTTSQDEESKSLTPVEADAQKKIAPNLPSEKTHDLRLFVKADSQSSIDALTQALQEKNSDTYHVNVLRGIVGSIHENDVKLAVLSKASIIGLRVTADPGAKVLAEKEGVVIHLYSSIPEAVENIGKGMEGALEPESQKADEGNLLPVETKAAAVSEKKVTSESKPAVKSSALDMAVAAVTKAFTKPKLVLTPEQTASPMTEAGMKVATPVVMGRMENGMRYGTLRNPGKDVFVKGKGEQWMPAKDGMVILPGDEVKTAAEGSVEVMLDGGKVGRVEVKEGSLFRIAKAETDPATGDMNTLLDLAIGKILVKVESLKGNSRFEVKSPTALTGVRGTVFEVTVKEKA